MSIQTGVITKNTNSLREGIYTMPTQHKIDKQFSLKVEAVRALELSNRLHSTLNLEELMNMYAQETQTFVPFDNINYTHPDNIFSFSQGDKKRHSCQYRLLIGGKNLGELEFTRSKRFTDEETINLEYTLSSLLNPLHNGLMYQQAIINSLLDPLTGVKNRSAFDSSISREVSLSKRHNNPFAMIILDIDLFKNINDKFGHLFGDCVLRDVAQTIKDEIRDSDMVFRYGGEEFVILLSNTCETGALLLAERIRQSIAQMTFSYNGNSTLVTASQGIACLKQNELELELFKRADDALYHAKDSGRNCTQLAEV